MDIKVFITKKDGLLNISSSNVDAIARQYDNNAHKFIFERPEEYQDHSLALVFSMGIKGKDGGTIVLGMENEYEIPDALLTENTLKLQIKMSVDESTERSNILSWVVDQSIASIGDIPSMLPNEFDKLRAASVVDFDVIEKDLLGFNIDGDEVTRVELPQSEGGETPEIITTDDVVGLDGETKLSEIIEDMVAKDNNLEDDLNKKVDAEDGKGLSSNDYTDENKETVDGLEAFYELVNEKFSEIDKSLSQNEPTQITALRSNPAGWGLPGTQVAQFYKVYGDSDATGLPSWWLTSGDSFSWIGLFSFVTYGVDEPDKSGKLYLFKLGTTSGGSDIAKSDYIGASLRWNDWDGLATYSYVDEEIEKLRDIISQNGVLTVNSKTPDGDGNVDISANDLNLEGLPPITAINDLNPEDSVLYGMAKLQAQAKASHYSATATKSGNLVTITSDKPNIDMTKRYAVVFEAPSDFDEDDSYYINGATITLVDENKRSLVDPWMEGVPVGIVVSGSFGYFVGTHVGSNRYTLSKRAVGVWDDGRIVHEAVIDGIEMPNSTSITILHGIENIDFHFDRSVTAVDNSKTGQERKHIDLTGGYIGFDDNWEISEKAMCSIYDDAIIISSDFDMSNYVGTAIFKYVED